MPETQYRRPSDEDFLALARSLAKVAHSGQTRRGNGEPYFNHVERVAEYVREHRGLRAATIGFLHDTIEDTTVLPRTLRDLGFPWALVRDVELLTRGTDEKYMHYIGRVVEFASTDALNVKLADLADNLSDLDAKLDPSYGMHERYLSAQQHILDEIERREILGEVRDLERAARAA